MNKSRIILELNCKSNKNNNNKKKTSKKELFYFKKYEKFLWTMTLHVCLDRFVYIFGLRLKKVFRFFENLLTR